MERKTNLRMMDAPAIASGKVAGDTVLAHNATGTSAEKEGNQLEEYTTPPQDKKDLGGQNKFK